MPGVHFERKNTAVIRRQRLLFAIGCAEEYQPKPWIDCRGRPDVAATAALSSVNMAVCVKPAVNFQTPDQIPGFSVKGHKTSPIGDAEGDPTGVSAEE